MILIPGGSKMDLKKKTLKMKNWAVVGATDKNNKFGYKIYKRLKQNGYNVFAVNPNIEQLLGDRVYDSLAEIEAEIDVVDLVVNPKIGIKVMEEIDKKGIKYVWAQPGARSSEIRKFAEKHDIEYIRGCVYVEVI